MELCNAWESLSGKLVQGWRDARQWRGDAFKDERMEALKRRFTKLLDLRKTQVRSLRAFLVLYYYKVQILTPQRCAGCVCNAAYSRLGEGTTSQRDIRALWRRQVLSLLALLVQKYTYGHI